MISIEVFIVALVGLCIGSFLNVCIYRISREESIVYPQSHCISCGYSLKPVDLIPIISYIMLKGRCRKCGDKISIRYPVVEALNCILYVLIYLKYGITLNIIVISVFISLLLVIAFIDYESKFIFNTTIYFGLLLGIIFNLINIYFYREIPWNNLIAAIIGYIIIGVIVIATKSMGEGDIYIACTCGLFLGIKGILLTIFLSFIIGGIVAGVILVGKYKNRKDEIAFGPYLVLGTIITIFFGEYLINQYETLYFTCNIMLNLV